MAPEIDDAEKQRIAEALTGVMPDGRKCFVQCSGGEVTVESQGSAAEFRRDHAELYGQLLTANEGISDAGSFVTILLMVGGLLVCLAVHMAWFDGILGVPVGSLQSWWFYVLVAVGVFGIIGAYGSAREQQVYGQYRQEIFLAIDEAGLTKNTVLAAINDDPALKSIAERLRKDRSDSSRPARQHRY